MSSFKKIQAKKWLKEKGLLPSQIEERQQRARYERARTAATSTVQSYRSRPETVSAEKEKDDNIIRIPWNLTEMTNGEELQKGKRTRKKSRCTSASCIRSVDRKPLREAKWQSAVQQKEKEEKIKKPNPLKGGFADNIPFININEKTLMNKEEKRPEKRSVPKRVSTPNAHSAQAFILQRKLTCLVLSTIKETKATSSTPLKLLRAPRIPKIIHRIECMVEKEDDDDYPEV